MSAVDWNNSASFLVHLPLLKIKLAVIYLGEFAKSDFMTDIACPHIRQHFLTCRQTVFLLFFTCTGCSNKDINLCF